MQTLMLVGSQLSNYLAAAVPFFLPCFAGPGIQGVSTACQHVMLRPQSKLILYKFKWRRVGSSYEASRWTAGGVVDGVVYVNNDDF